MSKRKPCGLDYCPQEEIIGAYASCTACAWDNGYDDKSKEEVKEEDDRIVEWQGIKRAISTLFYCIIVYIIYVISLGTKNENAVTQSFQWIPHFWYLTVVIYYIL